MLPYEFNLETYFLIAEASFHLYKFTGSGRRKSDLCQPSQLFLIFIDLGRLDHGACSVKCLLTYCSLCRVHDLIVISADIFMSLHNLTNMVGASVPFEVL